MNITKYFKSFDGHTGPPTPIDVIAFSETKNLPTYYIGIIGENDALVEFRKISVFKRESRLFLLQNSVKNKVVYFIVEEKQELPIDWRPVLYEETEGRNEYYCGIVDESGLAGSAYRFERITAFVQKYRVVSRGIVNILATFNNTTVSITDMVGNSVGWSSAGRVGFKGSRKSTAFAAQQVATDAGRQAMSRGMREIEVRIKGPGSGRESAVRALQDLGFVISTIKDVTPISHQALHNRKKRVS